MHLDRVMSILETVAIAGRAVTAPEVQAATGLPSAETASAAAEATSAPASTRQGTGKMTGLLAKMKRLNGSGRTRATRRTARRAAEA